MVNFLEKIVADKRLEIERQKEVLSPRELARMVDALMEERDRPLEVRSMRESLASSPSGIIAEFKRKSPSRGWIHEDARPEDVVPAYDRAGASALSILTDGPHFGGSLEYISRVRDLVKAPILRKEFIIDEYQLFQARLAGADAVLLIAADLSMDLCRRLMERAKALRLEVLLEIHDESELDFCSLSPDMVGVNNRNLETFRVDVAKSLSMASKLQSVSVRVSESGISSPEKVKELRSAGYRGFLIGETFMKEEDPGEALKNFIASTL